MKTYEIHLKLLGSMTQMPDSQKLFGALVYLFAQTYGQEKTAELVQAVLHQELHLALSNVLPKGYLPMPQDYFIDELAKINDANADRKKMRSGIKERNYIETSQLAQLLENSDRPETVFPYIKLETRQQLRTTINGSPDETSGIENNLYSVPFTYPVKIQKTGDLTKEKIVSDFCFYVQTESQGVGHSFIEMLNAAVSRQQILILGKRASQGLNTYEFCKILQNEKCSAAKGENYFLNTGMLLPNHIDLSQGWLNLFTSERRPFQMPGGWHQQGTKYFISFISEGSVVYGPNGLERAGRCLQSPYNKERDVVFGNAFLYPITIPKRRTEHAKNAKNAKNAV